MDEKQVGWFTVDVAHEAQGKISIHSNINIAIRVCHDIHDIFRWLETNVKSEVYIYVGAPIPVREAEDVLRDFPPSLLDGSVPTLWYFDNHEDAALFQLKFQ